MCLYSPSALEMAWDHCLRTTTTIFQSHFQARQSHLTAKLRRLVLSVQVYSMRISITNPVLRRTQHKRAALLHSERKLPFGLMQRFCIFLNLSAKLACVCSGGTVSVVALAGAQVEAADVVLLQVVGSTRGL